jgi:hypothetical protein
MSIVIFQISMTENPSETSEALEVIYDLSVYAWKFRVGSDTTFLVKAAGRLPSPAWQAFIRRAEPQGFNPQQLLLHLDVVSTGMPAPQVITPFSETYSETSNENGGDYDSTLILAPSIGVQAEFLDIANAQETVYVACCDTSEIQNIIKTCRTDLEGSGIIVGGRQSQGEAGGFVSFSFNRNTYTKRLVRRLTWYELDGRHRGDLMLRVSHPRISEITADIDTCVTTGAVAGTIAGIGAIVSGAGGAVPAVITAAFKAALIACLVAKGFNWATQISVSLYLRDR